MEPSDPLQPAVQAIERAVARASDLRSFISTKGTPSDRDHLEQLLHSLQEARAELDAGSQLIAAQAAHIRQLSVISINSTARSF